MISFRICAIGPHAVFISLACILAQTGGPITFSANDSSDATCQVTLHNAGLVYTPLMLFNTLAPGQSINLIRPTVATGSPNEPLTVTCADPDQILLGRSGFKRCWALGCANAGTMLCTRCRCVNYCGVEHQRSDWPFHKQVCIRHKQVASAPQAVLMALEIAGGVTNAESFSFVDARTVIRSSAAGGVGVFATAPLAAGTVVLVEQAQFEEAKSDHSKSLARIALTTTIYNTNVLKLLELHTDPLLMNRDVYHSLDLKDVAPNHSFGGGYGRASLLRLIGVAPLNPFASSQTNALAFCLNGARFNHACYANACVVTAGSAIVIYAARDIAVNDEICIQYYGVGEPPRSDFTCQCRLCVDDLPIPAVLQPFGERPKQVVEQFQRFVDLLSSEEYMRLADAAARQALVKKRQVHKDITIKSLQAFHQWIHGPLHTHTINLFKDDDDKDPILFLAQFARADPKETSLQRYLMD